MIVVRYQNKRGWIARKSIKDLDGKRPSFRLPYVNGKREAARLQVTLNAQIAAGADFEWVQLAVKHLMGQQVPLDKWADELERIRKENIPLHIESVTLKSWHDAFLEAKRNQPHPRRANKRLSPKTIEFYEQAIKRLIDFFGENTSLQKAASDFAKFAHERIDNVTSQSWRSNLSAFRTAFKFAVDHGWLPASPIDKLPATMKPAPHVAPVDRTLSRAQIKTLLNAVKNALPNWGDGKYHTARVRAHIASLYYVAWRPIDSILATPNCVDIKAGTISFTQIKTGRPHVVPILKPFMPILKAWLKAMPSDSPVLFPNRLGKPYARGGLKKVFRSVQRKAGLPDWVTPYTLRHSMATELIYRGCAPAQVADMLGDATVDMVLRHYCHKNTAKLNEINDLF